MNYNLTGKPSRPKSVDTTGQGQSTITSCSWGPRRGDLTQKILPHGKEFRSLAQHFKHGEKLSPWVTSNARVVILGGLALSLCRRACQERKGRCMTFILRDQSEIRTS
jgi:hypothetical protein